MPPPEHRPLRRAVLAVQVLWDVDLLPADDGVVLPGDPALEVSWDGVLPAPSATSTPRASRPAGGCTAS